MTIRAWSDVFQINTTTAGNQLDPDAVVLPDGSFAIAWEAAGGGVRMRRFFDAAQGPLAATGETEIISSGDPGGPDLGLLGDGTLLMAWRVSFGAGLVALSPDLAILDDLSIVTGFDVRDPDLGPKPAGALLATAGAAGVNGIIRVDEIGWNGTVLFNPGTSATTSPGASSPYRDPDIARLADGNYAVVYLNDTNILLQLLNAGAAFLTNQIGVANSGSASANPEVTALVNGGFVITWRADFVAFPGSGADVMGQIFTPDGAAFGNAFQLNERIAGAQTDPVIVATQDGGFVAFWYSDDGAQRVRARAFSAEGTPRGPEISLDARFDGAASFDSLDAKLLRDGRILLTWADTAGPEDADGAGIVGQIVDPRDGLIEGTDAADTLYGNFGSDQIEGFDGGDVLHGLGGSDRIVGGRGGDQVFGGRGGDDLFGGDGADIVGGGAGPDSLLGGAGDDFLGADTGDDEVTGGAGLDTLEGGAGNDTLSGGAGTDALLGEQGDDALSGGAENDLLSGGDGADTLDGGAGTDLMDGGAGDDHYLLDNAGDQVTELPGGGIDQIEASVSVELFALAPQVENLRLTGSAGLTGGGNALANEIVGNSGDNNLFAGFGADTIVGDGGNDTLDGGPGDDQMYGNAGNDVYRVDSALDAVTELLDEGIADRIEASVSVQLFAFAPQVENLTLTGTAGLTGGGNALANRIIGNSGNNNLFGGFEADTIEGSAGNDTLDGGPGTDSLTGGPGDDLYRVDSASDAVVETAGGGTDRIESTISLALFTFGQEIETLILTGAGNLNGTGNGRDNRITGNSGGNLLTGGSLGNDTLEGGAGNDTLTDEAGADVLTGGDNADVFRFQSTTLAEANVITDFVTGVDQIELENAVFTGLAAGNLPPGAFVSGAAPVATQPDDRLLYNTTTGALRYDPDGNGAAPSVLFVTLQGAPALAFGDFETI